MGTIRVSVEVDEEIWRKISILAAAERKMKKEVVNEALRRIILDTHVIRLPLAPEETRPSRNLEKNEKESGNHEEENHSGSNSDSGSPGPGGSDGLGR